MMSSRETLWLPPALTRAPETETVASGAWTLPDLGAPLAVAEPVDASFEAGYAAGLRDGPMADATQRVIGGAASAPAP